MKNQSNFAAAKAARARQRMSNTTLTESDVRTIRRARDRDLATVEELADQFGLGLDTVRKIAGRKTFRWLGEVAIAEMNEPDIVDRILPKGTGPKTTAEQFAAMQRLSDETAATRNGTASEVKTAKDIMNEAEELLGKLDKKQIDGIAP